MKSVSTTAASQLGSAADVRVVDSTRQVLWLTAVSVLLLVAIAVVAFFVVSQELRAARTSHAEVQETRETLEQVQLVMSTLQDAETGERGYVITGAESFLEPFYLAEQSLEERLQDLDASIDNAQSQAMLNDLAARARQQQAFLRRVTQLRKAEGTEAAVALIKQEVGRKQMDAIRGLVAQLDAHEKSLLAQRLALFRERSMRSELIVRVALGAAIMLVLVAGALLVRHTHRRLQAENAARDALTLLSATIENLSQGVAVFDGELRLVEWNSRFLELRGLNSTQVFESMTLQEILRRGASLSVRGLGEGLDTDDTRTSQPSLEVLRRGFDLEASSEEGLILHVRGRPIATGHFILTYTDVTALKMSERAYRDQATRLASILDNVVDAIITINESGSIESWSKGAERLFGYTADEVLRRNVRILMPEPHQSAHDGYLRRYVQTGERRIIGQRREVEGLHKDGRRVPVDLGISEMLIGSRRLFIGIVRDISARLEVEQLKSGFVSTVSHELRTPLTSISGSLGLLAGGVAGELPAKASRLIDIAKLNCERLVRLINDILDLEKAESGKLDFRLESQQLQPIVQQAIDMNRAYAHDFGAVIELDPGSADATVLIDRDRLLQVLTNLLSNAAKFSPRGGTIRVAIESEPDSARVSVRDQGPGIALEFQRRIFQKFAQADSSDARVRGGTGLGLSIAKTIIERLGGAIGFQSTPGQGAMFYISLPIQSQPAAISLSTGMSGVIAGPAVLICEDDPDVARLLVELLRHEGMRAETVPTASAAWAALGAERFDVAIVDLHLPDADGLEFIAELRAREATSALPVIVLTASSKGSADRDIISSLQLADWLQKPIDPRRLLEAIHNVLVMRPQQRARILHVEDDESLTHLVRELLSAEADVSAAHSLAQARWCVAQADYDLVILDIMLGDGSGLDVLPLLRRNGRAGPPVILYSATEASREISNMVQAALVKSRHSVEQLLASVRTLAKSHGSPPA